MHGTAQKLHPLAHAQQTKTAAVGAGKGIGHLAGNAVESIARQPEAGGRIFVSMLLAAALIEGFTFFAIVTCSGVGDFLTKAAAVATGG